MVLTWDQMIHKHAESLWILTFWVLAAPGIQEEISSYLEILQVPFSNWVESLTIRKRPLMSIELAWDISCNIIVGRYTYSFLSSQSFQVRLKNFIRISCNWKKIVCIVFCIYSSLYIWLIILGADVKCWISHANSTHLTNNIWLLIFFSFPKLNFIKYIFCSSHSLKFCFGLLSFHLLSMIFAYQLACRQANSSYKRDATYTKQVKNGWIGPPNLPIAPHHMCSLSCTKLNRFGKFLKG